MECTSSPQTYMPWNKVKLVGQKAQFSSRKVWAIRVRLQMESRARELALCDLGIDSKLRVLDLVTPAGYGTDSMRRTKVSLIYRRTKNLRAVQLLLGHSKLESTVMYLGIEVDDALELAEQADV